MAKQFWIETLGCPKNQVDSDKLVGTMMGDGLKAATSLEDADLVVVNTCAFIEEARQESIDTILSLDESRPATSELIVTGCLAERYGDDLAEALPEVDKFAGFGVPVELSTKGASQIASPTGSVQPAPSMDLLEMPRPPSAAPGAYVKIAEGCDRNCGFCAIPSFRGKQRSRSIESIVAEVESLSVAEIVLVAQDLAAFGRDQGKGERRIIPLLEQVSKHVPWVRLLYLYPSDLNDELIEAICATGVPYFDLSLQHVSRPLLRSMRRWGDGDIFLERISRIRERQPGASFRSNFIVGYPGESEADHDRLLSFVEEAQLNWCGFFAYSKEEGTYAADLGQHVPTGLMDERLSELRELQDRITAEAQDGRVGQTELVLVDGDCRGRSVSEAPEIDGVINLDRNPNVGRWVSAEITDAAGPDLYATVLSEFETPPPLGAYE